MQEKRRNKLRRKTEIREYDFILTKCRQGAAKIRK